MKKINVLKDCINGNHKFIVGSWNISNPRNRHATTFICQNCLMEVQKTEQETHIKSAGWQGVAVESTLPNP